MDTVLHPSYSQLLYTVGPIALIAVLVLLCCYWLWRKIDNRILVRCVDTAENRAILFRCQNAVGRQQQQQQRNLQQQQQQQWVNPGGEGEKQQQGEYTPTYPVLFESVRVNKRLSDFFFDDTIFSNNNNNNNNVNNNDDDDDHNVSISPGASQLEVCSVKKSHLCMKPVLVQVVYSENWRKVAERNLLRYERHLIHTPDGGNFSVEWWPKMPSPEEMRDQTDKPVILVGFCCSMSEWLALID